MLLSLLWLSIGLWAVFLRMGLSEADKMLVVLPFLCYLEEKSWECIGDVKVVADRGCVALPIAKDSWGFSNDEDFGQGSTGHIPPGELTQVPGASSKLSFCQG